MNFLNIKKAKSYRINNNNRISKTTALSMRKKSLEKINKINNNNNININNNNNKKLDKNNFLKIVNNITNKKNINDKKYIHIDSIEINNIIKSNEKKDGKENVNIDSNNGSNKFQNVNVTNEELMKKIKNSLDDNLKVMLNFSYENFLSKESERE